MKLLKRRTFSSMFLMLPAAALSTGILAHAGERTNDTVPVRMTVTANVEKGRRAPQVEKSDVFVRAGKEALRVLDWVPARGEQAGLELFLVIDDAAMPGFASELDNLRSFIHAQAPSTAVGVAYARNATVEIRQDLTSDSELAVRALRMPMGSAGAFGSPYLSLTSLMNRWPSTSNRREVILVTDGIDRAGRGRNALINPDVDAAAAAAQKTGTIVHTIYYPGAGHRFRNWFEAVNGQNAMAKLSDLTGGECFFLGREQPVNLAPYLEDLRNILDNQYLLTFAARPAKKAGLQYVTLGTEVAGVDFSAPDAVWVPTAR